MANKKKPTKKELSVNLKANIARRKESIAPVCIKKQEEKKKN